VIDLSEEQKRNTFDWMRVNCESVSNEIDESDVQHEKHDLELLNLLWTFLYVQNTSKINEQLDALQREKIEARDRIAQLAVDLDVARRKIAELEAQIEQLQEAAETATASSGGEVPPTTEKLVQIQHSSEPSSVISSR
jgi:uncharacterized coiled-coil DUF342 family protein